MSSPRDPSDDREVFRSPGAMILSLAWLVVALAVLVDLAVQGTGRDAVVAALVVAAVTGIMYGSAWRPRIVADADGVTVMNPTRDHHVPWTAVADVDLVNALRIHCVPAPGAARGRVISSWAVQSTARAALRREMAQRRAEQRGARAGFGRWPAPPPRSGRVQPAVQEVMNRSPAQHAVARLEERARRAHMLAAAAAGAKGREKAAGEPASPAGAVAAGAAARGAGAGVTPGAGAGQPTARWAWVSIAAMVVPTAACVAALLA